MKTLVTAAIFSATACLFPAICPAQTKTDSLALSGMGHPQIDSIYAGKSIFDVLPKKADGTPGSATVHRSQSVNEALQAHIEANGSKEVSGYRIRIYFSNAQNAREASAAAASRFSEAYPCYAVYRIYVSPNFKVTVGDFRTKSEALQLLGLLQRNFPSAFIVKENIRTW